MIPQILKGFRDFLPEEAIKRQWLIEKIKSIFEQWGYDPLETPTLEPLDLFKGQIGEGEKLFYQFKDQGGREVALRYDQTVPACRVVNQYFQKLPMPFRRYQIQPAFRAEKPQKGRYREFLQCDADIFGISSPIADAEVIALALDTYRQIGFKEIKVLINDRSLLKDIPYQILVEIDKLKKIGEEKVLENLIKKGIEQEQAKNYLSIIKNIQPNETIKTILDYLKKLKFPESWFLFEPTIVRSFSYSTGPIWEIEIPGYTGGSVLGGERYDQLMEKLFGLKLPATGYGLGFDRTLEAAEQFNLIPIQKTTTIVLVTIFSSDLFENSLSLTDQLRKLGTKVELYPDKNTKLEKQLKYADKKGVPYVVIIGPDEVKKGGFIVKKMATKEQKFCKEVKDFYW